MSAGSVALVVTEETDMHPWDLYELGIAYAVFGRPQPDLADPWYDLWLCGPRTSETGPARGFSLRCDHDFDALARADTVIVPSVPEAVFTEGMPVDPDLIRGLRRAAESGARMVSLCMGAFALAEAGLLDGRRATAHWMHTEDLARRFPKVEIDDSVLYIDDGDVLTSAGMTAGLDLCLHLVRQDLGAHVANALARRMVVPTHRAGGQAQFIDLSVPVTDDESLAPVLQWATEHLHLPLSVNDLARRAGMSPRTFFRQVQSVTGTTPLQWLLNQRLAHAQSLLESTQLPIEQVSRHSGLGTAANLRRHFALHVGVTPTDYRRAFEGGVKREPVQT
jgi:transcriptional regulator GlxA family with amidase domain